MTSSKRAERFKKARTEKNIHGSQSRDQVCNDTGIAVSLLEDLENYKKDRQVAYQKIAILAKHYGVSADYLLGLTDCPAVDDKEKAACEYTGLSADAIESLHVIYGENCPFDDWRDLTNGFITNCLFPIIRNVANMKKHSTSIETIKNNDFPRHCEKGDWDNLYQLCQVEKLSAIEYVEDFINEFAGYSMCRHVIEEAHSVISSREADVIIKLMAEKQ